MSKMISLTEDGMFVASDNITPTDYINITLTAQLNMFNHLIDNAPEEHKVPLKEELFDLYNSSASAFLNAFAPEISLRPDLTEEAILRAENEILAERAAQVAEENPALVQELEDNIVEFKKKKRPAFEDDMKKLANNIKEEMQKDGLIPTDGE